MDLEVPLNGRHRAGLSSGRDQRIRFRRRLPAPWFTTGGSGLRPVVGRRVGDQSLGDATESELMMSGLPHPTLPHFVERMQRRLDDGDLLLVCGFGVPLLLVVVWVAAMAVARTPWLVLPIAVLVAAAVLARAYVRIARNSPGRGGSPPA